MGKSESKCRKLMIFSNDAWSQPTNVVGRATSGLWISIIIYTFKEKGALAQSECLSQAPTKIKISTMTILEMNEIF